MQWLGGVLLVVAAIVGQLGGLVLFVGGFFWAWGAWGVVGVVLWLVFGLLVVSAMTALVTVPLWALGQKLAKGADD